jgi:hypothetical protein
VPALYFVYVYYRMRILRSVLDNLSNVSQENEAFLPAHHGSGATHS